MERSLVSCKRINGKAFQSTMLPSRFDIFPHLKNKVLNRAKYLRPYLTFKSQYTFLATVQEGVRISKGLSSKDDQNKLEYLSFLIDSLRTSTIGRILDTANTVMDSLYKIISSKTLSPAIEKTALCILKSSLSIRHVSTYLDSNSREETVSHRSDDSSDQLSMDGDDDEMKDDRDENEGSYVICRICDERIPFDLLQHHTQYCLQAYKSETRRNEIVHEIQKHIEFICDEKLNVPWFGAQNDIVNKYVPLLHAMVLLQHSLDIDPSVSDSYEDLKNLSSVISKIPCEPEFIPVIRKCEQIVLDCSRVSKALLTASSGLVLTRLSKNPKPASVSTVTIADFDFVKRISSGAFARVFIAKKHKTGDIFAIKAIPKTCLIQKNQTKRVMAEKDILLGFSNPYIVTFYYSIIGTRNLYLVTEFVPGGDLYSLLQSVGSFDEESSKIYIAEILEALKYLRENGIIHRDLKPDNILVTASGTLKLTDFGLSRQGVVNRQMSGESDDLSSEPEIVGTLDYMAPEVLLNKPHSFAVDYWSLGAMLYEFLIGIPPFNADTEAETTKNIMRGAIFYENADEISQEARDLIQRLLEPIPECRLGYSNIQEIFEHPWLKGIDPKTAAPPFQPKLRSETDTTFFEERYKFSKNTDNDIIQDIAENMRPSTLNISPIETSDISSFPSLSIDNLVESNMAAAQRMKRSQSMSPPPPSPSAVKAAENIFSQRRMSESKIITNC